MKGIFSAALNLFLCIVLLCLPAGVTIAAPDAVTDLAVQAGWRRITLTWTAPIDDSTAFYKIRCSTYTPIINETNWNNNVSSNVP